MREWAFCPIEADGKPSPERSAKQLEESETMSRADTSPYYVVFRSSHLNEDIWTKWRTSDIIDRRTTLKKYAVNWIIDNGMTDEGEMVKIESDDNGIITITVQNNDDTNKYRFAMRRIVGDLPEGEHGDLID